MERAHSCFRDARFKDLPAELPVGCLLVINNARVFPARLFGWVKGRSGRIEVLLIRETDVNKWEALVRPGRSIKTGAELTFGDGSITARVTGAHAEGMRDLEFSLKGAELWQSIERFGRVPLPPYILRDQTEDLVEDRERYQTIFARDSRAIAAPTAGLHFTETTLADLAGRGIKVTEITHQVGLATFQPIRSERVEDHRMDRETFFISDMAAQEINSARREGRPVYAVGTTAVRALESAALENGGVAPGRGETRLFIHPPYKFRVIDGLLTNFHLPRSTLLMLVAALAGRDLVLRAYCHAVEQSYRFYSYGDCMLIR